MLPAAILNRAVHVLLQPRRYKVEDDHNGVLKMRVWRHFNIGRGRVKEWPVLTGPHARESSVTGGQGVAPKVAVRDSTVTCKSTTCNQRVLDLQGDAGIPSVQGQTSASVPGASHATPGDTPLRGRRPLTEIAMAASTLSTKQRKQAYDLLHASIDTSIKCQKCTLPFLTVQGCDTHSAACNGPPAPHVPRSQLAYDGVMEQRGILEAPAAKPNCGDPAADVDMYIHGDVSAVLPKPAMADWRRAVMPITPSGPLRTSQTSRTS